jgi:hypothetical protein
MAMILLHAYLTVSSRSGTSTYHISKKGQLTQKIITVYRYPQVKRYGFWSKKGSKNHNEYFIITKRV